MALETKKKGRWRQMKKKKLFMTAGLLMMLAGNSALCTFAEETETESAAAGNVSDQIASSDEMASPVDILEEDMVPIYAESLKEGTYEIEVLSSSSMFKIAECQLTVEDGEMSASILIMSDSYLRLFPGTGADAVTASEEDYITYEETEEGYQLYEFPVEALDMGIDCAAYSKRREKWYDRTLVFSAASLPQSAYQESMILTAEELGLEDGVYTVEAVLDGGAGKTTVESPVTMTVQDGQVTAVVTISSKNYNYVIVDGTTYDKINEEGNSSFEIPVAGFDFRMLFIANSTAMGKSHEIDYTLFFDSATIQSAE